VAQPSAGADCIERHRHLCRHHRRRADTTIRDPEQVARALDTSVIGALPVVKEMRLLQPGGGNLVTAGLSLPISRNSIESWCAIAGQDWQRQEEIENYLSTHQRLRRNFFLRRGDPQPAPFHSAADPDRNVRSLLITSASPGEGKSTAIIHLAIAHSEQGRRTLIVDADLRRPSVHKNST